MMAMQYSVRLPEDFNAAKVQARVAERSGLFDNLPGLLHKSFLFDMRNRIYAPFYIWQDPDAARRFFLDERMFESVVVSFGRPRVHRWMVLDFDHGVTKTPPDFARCEIDKVEGGASLRSLIDREGVRHREMLTRPGLFAHLFALDADRWELVRYSLWQNAAAAAASDADCIQEYQVLHVSEPRTASAA